jgi:hypothetical protein
MTGLLFIRGILGFPKLLIYLEVVVLKRNFLPVCYVRLETLVGWHPPIYVSHLGNCEESIYGHK